MDAIARQGECVGQMTSLVVLVDAWPPCLDATNSQSFPPTTALLAFQTRLPAALGISSISLFRANKLAAFRAAFQSFPTDSW